MSLQQDSITFGKYKGSSLVKLLRDRSYCKWLIEQDWFIKNYEYLYNRVREYDPKIFFLNSVTRETKESEDFINSYIYFNLLNIEDLQIPLSTVDEQCYGYYLRMILEIRCRIYQRMENEEPNPFDIKAPTKWLKRFEEEYGIPRNDFKEFIEAYELPNIPYIIESVKKEGGVEYKGAQSFKIAKARSEAQEQWWTEILKEKHGEDLGTQFKFENCIFDMVLVNRNIIFECKLGFKDMNEEQYQKYRKTLAKYRIVYIIGYDTIIILEKNAIYTTNPDKCSVYLSKIPSKTRASNFDKLIAEFSLIKVDSFDEILNEITRENITDYGKVYSNEI